MVRAYLTASRKALTGPAPLSAATTCINHSSPSLHTANMPSDLSYWIISAPLKDGDAGIMLSDVRGAVGDNVEVGQWEVPELKVSLSYADSARWSYVVAPPLGRTRVII